MTLHQCITTQDVLETPWFAQEEDQYLMLKMIHYVFLYVYEVKKRGSG